MLPEIICPECLEKLGDKAEGIEKESNVEEYCELCSKEIIGKYFSISKVELNDVISKEIESKILACGSDGCGRKWDSEDNDYILDETNSNIIELFDEILTGMDKGAYYELLHLINYEGFTDEIELPDVECPNCGSSIDGWYDDIKTEAIYRTLPVFPKLPSEIKTLPLKTSVHRIEYYRPDCSPYLIHLTHANHVVTGYSNVDYQDVTEHLKAPQILWLMLSSQTLRKSQGVGLREEVVCFSEKPLIGLKETLLGEEFNEREGSAITWAPYGLMFEKDYLVKLGVKPVLPLDYRDEQLLPQEMKWRTVPLSNSINFLHEREWRYNNDIKFESTECVVLVPDFIQAENFRAALELEKIKVKGILPMEIFACI